jgi:hypothetical protein
MNTMPSSPADLLPSATPGDDGGLSLDAAVALQDDLLTACNDLDRLLGLLRHACAQLGDGFHGAVDTAGRHRAGALDATSALSCIEEQLGRTVTALQFEDMSTQLIVHTRARLRHSADRLAATLLLDDEDGPGFVELAPLRPNPVTQDEMDAGSVELF